MPSNKIDSLGAWKCPYLMFLSCFIHFQKMPGNQLDSWGCPHSALLLCFTSTSFERTPENKLDSLEVSTFTARIAFYMLAERCRVTNLITWGALFNVSITFWTLWKDTWVNKIDSLEVPTFNAPILFHTLCRRCPLTRLIPSPCPHSMLL